MTTEKRSLDLQAIFRADVARLVGAHHIGKVLHRGRNVRAAGDEVEIEARALLRRRLPGSFYVGEGHIVDAAHNQSPQCDVVIADVLGSQVLTTAASETKFFPYESVYAVGEIKSSYRKRDIEKFAGDLAKIKVDLCRERVYDLVNEVDGIIPRRESDPYRNPLFSFMLIVDSPGFKVKDIQDIYERHEAAALPSMICLLDRGNVFYCALGPEPGNFRPDLCPEMVSNSWTERTFWPEHTWGFLPHENDETKLESNFGLFYYVLGEFLQTCRLQPTPTFEYLRKFVNYQELVRIRSREDRQR